MNLILRNNKLFMKKKLGKYSNKQIRRILNHLLIDKKILRKMEVLISNYDTLFERLHPAQDGPLISVLHSRLLQKAPQLS